MEVRAGAVEHIKIYCLGRKCGKFNFGFIVCEVPVVYPRGTASRVDLPITEMFKLVVHGQLLVILQKGWPFGLDELTEHMDDTVFICTIPLCVTCSVRKLMEGDGGFCEHPSPCP